MTTDLRGHRRKIALFALFIACLSVLAACGSDDDDTAIDDPTVVAESPDDTAVEAETPDDTAVVAETRTVEHALGTSEVPTDPQRIVVAGRRGTLAVLMDLGLEPVGALDASFIFGQPFHPALADQAAAIGVEPVGKADNGPNLEDVARLEPDLIIGSANDFIDVADQLAAIAPTIGIEWDFEDPLANVAAVGEALDMVDETDALIADFEAAVSDAAESIENAGTVSIIGLFAPDDIRIYRSGNFIGTLTEAVGGTVVPTEELLALDPEDPVVNFVSLEQIGLANGERLISFVNEGAEADASYRSLEENPLIQALPAFQSGQVLELDPQLTFGTAGIGGLRTVLDQLVEFYR